MKSGVVQLGFKSSIIALFVAIVLVIGLTLVYLSFQRIAAVTETTIDLNAMARSTKVTPMM